MVNMKRMLSLLLCSIMTLCLLTPLSAFEKDADSTQKVVRVGYVNVKGYEEGGEGEYKTGFGYEYLQVISYYTDWQYEYVYASFSELIAMLAEGEIDLMGNVTATEERAEVMDFSAYPQGNETFYVFAKTERTDLIGAKPEALRGMRIGVGLNSYQSGLMDEYFANLGIEIQKVELNGTREIVDALEAGELDAAVMTDATDYGYAPVQVVGFHDYYFAVAKNRPELLKELDTALAQIQSADPDYNVTLAHKYSFGSANINYLDKNEREWLERHNNTIRLGYLENNLPYSATADDGSLTGVLKIVVDELEEKFGIQVETRAFDSVPASREAMSVGEVDCVGPIYGDFYLTEQFDKVQSNSVVTTTPVVLYKGKVNTDVIAVTNRSVFTAPVVQLLFPEAQIVEYDTIEECMSAVAEQEVGCTLVTSAKLNVLHKYESMNQLSYSELLQSANLCLFANHGESGLLTILNKAIYLSETQRKGATFVTSADSGTALTWKEFIRAKSFTFLIIAVVIIIFLIMILLYIVMTGRRVKRAEEQARKARSAVQELSQQVTTDPLTGLLNRYSMERDVEALEELSNVVVVSFDVNGLKEVNDNAGHEHGDELLQAAGQLIEKTFGDYGRCYHISGDEFTAIMDKNLDMVETQVQALKDECAQAKNEFFQVSISVGFARGSDYPSASFDKLHHKADQMMYADKIAHYRNKVYDRRKSHASEGVSRIATSLSEFVPGGYFAYEAQGNEELLYINNEMLNLFECSSKEHFMAYVNGSFQGIVHPDDLERVQQEIKNQIQNHMDLDYTEYRIVTARGNVKRVRDYGRYVSRANGTGIFYVMISAIEDSL